jgi:hypothetical protein
MKSIPLKSEPTLWSPWTALGSAVRPHLAAIALSNLKIVITRNRAPSTLRYALQKPYPRARYVVCARDRVSNLR